MKIAIVCEKFQKLEIIDTDHVPRVGDTIPLFYTPSPIVKGVLWVELGMKSSQGVLQKEFKDMIKEYSVDVAIMVE